MLEGDEACWAAEKCYGCFRGAEAVKGASEVAGEGFCVPKDIGLVEEERERGLEACPSFQARKKWVESYRRCRPDS